MGIDMFQENTRTITPANNASRAEKTPQAEPVRKTQETSDRAAQAVTTTMHALQDVMDKAILGGLPVEPSFRAVDNRFSNVGVSAESYLVKCNIFRRLS